jgi:hypothetical protein
VQDWNLDDVRIAPRVQVRSVIALPPEEVHDDPDEGGGDSADA